MIRPSSMLYHLLLFIVSYIYKLSQQKRILSTINYMSIEKGRMTNSQGYQLIIFLFETIICALFFHFVLLISASLIKFTCFKAS